MKAKKEYNNKNKQKIKYNNKNKHYYYLIVDSAFAQHTVNGFCRFLTGGCAAAAASWGTNWSRGRMRGGVNTDNL